jgi:hypothetical protein
MLYFMLCWKFLIVLTSETREGWPLLTVETEVNGDSKRTTEKAPSLGGSLGFSSRYKRFLFCLGCSIRSSTKYFFPHLTLLTFLILFAPSSSKLGRQPCWAACRLVCVSGSDTESARQSLIQSFLQALELMTSCLNSYLKAP